MHVLNSAKPQSGAIRIPQEEMTFSYSNSGGPGGQNVNKRQTKVRLSFDVLQSASLTLEQKTQVLRHPKLTHLVHGDGVISIASQVHKTQGQNKAAAVEQLHALIGEALHQGKERIPGGRPPGLKFPPSEHRKRQERRAEAAERRQLKDRE
jgi:ribosome-associated protein